LLVAVVSIIAGIIALNFANVNMAYIFVASPKVAKASRSASLLRVIVLSIIVQPLAM
jgi:uncharacterized membrane protein